MKTSEGSKAYAIIPRMESCFYAGWIIGLLCLIFLTRGDWVSWILGGALAGLAGFYAVKVHRPLKVLDSKFTLYHAGYDAKSVFETEEAFTLSEKRAREKMGLSLENHQVIRLSNRQAQYLALQNQINPHFLYNTLEAIRGDALSEGLDSVAHTTEALATFFRYTISNVDNLVTLEEELHNAENYFAIQNYRFGDKISLVVSADENDPFIWQCQVPKLTLQPIIENAIIHGLENKIGQGNVTIAIERVEDRLLIDILDDGVGMKEDVLSEINDRLGRVDNLQNDNGASRLGGIALVNVNNRIRLLFGDTYGIRVSSIEDFGTRVELVLPIRHASLATRSVQP